MFEEAYEIGDLVVFPQWDENGNDIPPGIGTIVNKTYDLGRDTWFFYITPLSDPDLEVEVEESEILEKVVQHA